MGNATKTVECKDAKIGLHQLHQDEDTFKQRVDDESFLLQQGYHLLYLLLDICPANISTLNIKITTSNAVGAKDGLKVVGRLADPVTQV